MNVPRDREGSFEPQLIGKHQRRLEGFDEKVLALYARGMTTRDISAHLRELYGTDVSHELISKATEHQEGHEQRPAELAARRTYHRAHPARRVYPLRSRLHPITAPMGSSTP